MGPSSILREEKIHSSIFTNEKLIKSSFCFFLELPDHAQDPEKWVRDLTNLLGYQEPDDAFAALNPPSQRMLVFPNGQKSEVPQTETELLRSALILARCGINRYLPDGPAIYTKSRLSRSVRLIIINTDYWYELDKK
jgi:hypothetical protein